jgi:hypothetical protein
MRHEGSVPHKAGARPARSASSGAQERGRPSAKSSAEAKRRPGPAPRPAPIASLARFLACVRPRELRTRPPATQPSPREPRTLQPGPCGSSSSPAAVRMRDGQRRPCAFALSRGEACTGGWPVARACQWACRRCVCPARCPHPQTAPATVLLHTASPPARRSHTLALWLKHAPRAPGGPADARPCRGAAPSRVRGGRS